MAKKETEAKLEQSATVKVEKVIASPPISLRTRNGSLKTTIVKDCHVPVERVKLDLDEGSGDAPTELDGESNIVGKIGETEIGETGDSSEPVTDSNLESDPAMNSDSPNSDEGENGSEPIESEKMQEDTEDVTQMSNKELKERLSNLGISTGPIVDSTRKIYERKLEKLLVKGKDLAYSTDEDAVPEQAIEPENAPPVKEKKVTRTKKVTKVESKAEKTEEKFSDEEEEEPVVKNTSSRRRSARILKSNPKTDNDVEKTDEETDENEEVQEQSEEKTEEPEKEEKTDDVTEETQSTETSESVQTVSCKTAITRHVHTILFFALVAVAGYLVYSESDKIQSVGNDLWDLVLDSYTRLYYSMMPEIETITQENSVPASEPQVGDPVPTDEL